jgi:hypothetical protein
VPGVCKVGKERVCRSGRLMAIPPGLAGQYLFILSLSVGAVIRPAIAPLTIKKVVAALMLPKRAECAMIGLPDNSYSPH